jgi:hypothetical protein
MKKIITLLVALVIIPSMLLALGINVSWDANPVADEVAGYRVFYGTAAGVYGAPIDVGKVLAYDIPNLNECTRYFVCVKAYDAAGNLSLCSTEVSLWLPDRTAPTGTLAINAGAASTTKVAVTLNLTASDACGTITGMRFSNDGVTYNAEIAYATTYAWTLTSGVGSKIVYAQFKDNSNNWSTAIPDSINLVADTTPPTPPANVKLTLWEQIIAWLNRLFRIG